MRLVERLEKAAAIVDALDDINAVDHGACGTVPFCHHQCVASAQLVNGLLELRTVPDGLAVHLLREDLISWVA